MTELQAGIDEIVAAGGGEPTIARDPVNQPMIHHWTDAIGDTNPIYVDEDAARAAGHDGIVAPPAMIQVWTMMGLGRTRSDDDPLARAMKLFDDAGYVGVVATNCDQTYHRYLKPGELVSMSAEITDVVGPKQTALGEGYFINQKIRWARRQRRGRRNGLAHHEVPRPAAGQAAAEAAVVPEDLDPDKLMRPSSSRDTKFFWDGINAHELRIQRRPTGRCSIRRCRRCGQEKDAPVDYLVASGKGTVFSYVVHHAPKVPGRTLPFVIALVELEEGVRMLGELRGIDPARGEDRITGARNVSRFPRQRCQPGLEPVRMGGHRVSVTVGTKLPELQIYGDPTFIVSTAIATRDYQDVHHDRDKAQAKGSKDIFVNILTDTGLVGRYVTDWAGPAAVVKSIKLRLGVPWYAYDTITFTGEVTAIDGDLVTLKVVGANSLGNHVIATSTLTLGDK